MAFGSPESALFTSPFAMTFTAGSFLLFPSKVTVTPAANSWVTASKIDVSVFLRGLPDGFPDFPFLNFEASGGFP